MPDHVHFMFAFKQNRATARVAPTVGSVVGAYKSLVANEWRKSCNEKNEPSAKIWQRNYFEHVIRNRQDYEEIKLYIHNNPSKRFYEED